VDAPVVVIVGGGFGGLSAAKTLRRAPVQIILIDRTNHHLFQPLLYQVATSVLAAGQIAAPIRAILRRQRNTTVILGEVTGVDKERKRVFVKNADQDGAPVAEAPLEGHIAEGRRAAKTSNALDADYL